MYFKLSLLFISFCGCSSVKQTESEVKTTQNAAIDSNYVNYRLYFNASRTLENPPDEVSLDTNGQLVFKTQQLMADGVWKNPKGLARLEPDDIAALEPLIKDSILYTIKSHSVSPPCPTGAVYAIRIERLDRGWTLSLNTNTCARMENSLSASQRKAFKALIELFEKIRVRYRPRLEEK